VRIEDAAAVKDRIATSGIQCFDAEPTDPPNQYTVLYDQAGQTDLLRLSGSPVDERTDFRLIVVARTRDGLRAAVTAIRPLLIRWRIQPGYEPIRELQASGMLPAGDSGDRRITETLVYRYNRPFGGNP
jgi:hypothetical protein